MKRRLFTYIIGGLVLSALIIFLVIRAGPQSSSNEIRVLLVYNGALTDKYPHVLDAYKSVLEEEGVPYDTVDAFRLITYSPSRLAHAPALIFPDGVNQILPKEMKTWIQGYLSAGGNLLIVSDAGVRDIKGVYLHEALFADMAGINYVTYAKTKDDAYSRGYITINGPSAHEFLEIPPGKTGRDNIIKGYKYERLLYPFARTENMVTGTAGQVHAYLTAPDGKRYPAFVTRTHEKGNVFFANPPLGYLKGHSDDLLLRLVLRTFLFKMIGMPHLMSVPKNQGGIVINWHIDSSVEWKTLPKMIADGYFRKGLRYSSHITAGDFLDQPGDGLGFDAEGKGRTLVKELQEFGVVGSHGGWGHNWYAVNVEEGRFSREEMEKYIRMNNEALERIVGHRIQSYSAPVGVHPQPVMTEILEKLGMIAYYYAGDGASAPNRSFNDGRMVSRKVIAFPIMFLEEAASFYEMKQAKRTEGEVGQWLKGTADYAAKNKTIRLIYSHPYNIEEYPKAILTFIDYLETQQKQGRLQVETMDDYAKFILRRLKTDCRFRMEEGRMIVKLSNPEGLQDLTVAVPKKGLKRPVIADKAILLEEDNRYYYLIIRDNTHEKTIDLPTA